jgi:hypothetical protein
MTRASYETKMAIHRAAQGDDSAATPDRIAELTEPLVEALLCSGEAVLTSPVQGSSGFAATFQAKGPRDPQGRSLRELDLQTRLLRHPLSYLVYSRAFESLPEPAKAQLYRRFVAVLSGEDRSERFAHLSEDDRRASLEILAATQPELAAVLPASLLAESSPEPSPESSIESAAVAAD